MCRVTAHRFAIYSLLIDKFPDSTEGLSYVTQKRFNDVLMTLKRSCNITKTFCAIRIYF